MRLVVNGRALSHFLCSPESLRELGVGWLLTQGFIETPAQIRFLRVCPNRSEIEVALGGEVTDAPHPAFVLTSGCGGGRASAAIYQSTVTKCSSPLQVDHSVIRKMMGDMYTIFARRQGSAGMHCAGLCHASNTTGIMVCCDIGRHNAVDKVIGRGLLANHDFGSSVLVTSGRVSSDMMFKAIRAGIPIVVSQHSVTSMAIDLAGAAGIALVSRLHRQDYGLHGQTDRVMLST